MAKTLLTTTGLLAGAAAFLAVNLLADRSLTAARIDLTENGLYTVSKGTLATVQALDEPVTLRLYYSDEVGNRYPAVRSYEQRVRGLLTEIEAHSGGKLRFERKKVEPFSDTEDEAEAAGVTGVTPRDSAQALYFGLVATGSTDEHEVIPFLDPEHEESLEYDVTRIIHKLGHTSKPSLAIVTALPLAGHPAMPWAGQNDSQEPYYVYEELQDLFNVSVVPPGATELPKGLDVLMVAHPKGISDELSYAIDQYVIHGGHALVMVDPWCESDQPPNDPQDPMARYEAQRSSSLPKLFDAWGLEMPADNYVGDLETALQAPAGQRRQTMSYVWYQALGKDQMSPDDVVTSSLDVIKLSTPGALKKKEGGTTTVTPLIHTSAQTQLLPTSQQQFMPDPERILSEFVPSNTVYTIAARVQGTVKTAFPDGKPKPANPAEAEKAAPDPDFLAESTQPVNLIVVADADLLADMFWVIKQPLLGQTLVSIRGSNGDFVRAALDNLAGSNDVISVHSRAHLDRPFKVIADMKREADQRFAQQEKDLEDKLQATEKKLADLESQKTESQSLLLSPEQQKEIDKFEQEKLETRKQLRDVQYALGKDIEHLQTWIKVVNIGLVPALLCVLAVALWGWRRQRRA